jgi:hypothetical protein
MSGSARAGALNGFSVQVSGVRKQRTDRSIHIAAFSFVFDSAEPFGRKLRIEQLVVGKP